jgi:hypothetical protein
LNFPNLPQHAHCLNFLNLLKKQFLKPQQAHCSNFLNLLKEHFLQLVPVLDVRQLVLVLDVLQLVLQLPRAP